MLNKISLHDTDIIMTYRGATPEREENLYAVLSHFEYTYTDYRIFLMEADAVPKFDWSRLSNPRIHHYFHHDSGPFPKALLCNTGVKLASSDVICLHDNDSIAEPHTLSGIIKDVMMSDVAKVLCPFHSVINVSGVAKQNFMDNPDYAQFQGLSIENLPADYNLLYHGAAGGINVWRRTDFIRVGGVNTAFVGWGGEDNELLTRSSQLGINWSSMITSMFHLNHDSINRKHFFQENEAAQSNMHYAEKLRKSSLEDIQATAEQLNQFFR